MQSNINQRDNTFDVAKGIAIILMCIGHTNCPKGLCEFIYMFHMAFFFMASGWFFNLNNLSDFRGYVWKKVKGLWWPFVTWGTAFILLHNWFRDVGLISMDNAEYSLRDIVWKTCTTITRFIPTEDMMGPYWFLSSLFYVSIGAWCVFWVAGKTRHSVVTAAVIFAALYCAAWADIYFGIGLGTKMCITFCAMAIFYVSYILHQGGYLLEIIKRHVLTCVFIPLCILFLFRYFGYGHISIPSLEMQNPLLFIIYSICGFVMLLAISTSLHKVMWMEKMLAYVGRNTLVILLANILCRNIVELLILKVTGYAGDISDVYEMYPQWYVWIGYTVFMLVMPLLINEVFERTKKLIIS